MKFEDRTIEGVLVVKPVEKRIVADVAAQFKEGLIGYVAKGNRTMVLDLSEVTFIDSTGLSALIGSLKATGNDGELLLSGARDSVANMLKLTRMDKVFRMFKSPEEAVSALA